MIPPVVMEWSYGTDQTMAVPGLGVDFRSGSTGATQYLIEYVTVTFGDLSTGEWFELPFQGGYKSSFVGSTGFDVTLSDALFFVSPTEIPLDNSTEMIIRRRRQCSSQFRAFRTGRCSIRAARSRGHRCPSPRPGRCCCSASRGSGTLGIVGDRNSPAQHASDGAAPSKTAAGSPGRPTVAARSVGRRSSPALLS